MTESCDICRLGRDDLDLLCELEAICFPGDPWSRAMLEGSLSSPHVSFLGIRRDGRLIGYAAVQTVADEGELLNLAVLPESRREGLGRRLLTEALSVAEKAGAAACYLEVREHNVPAIGLYESVGFRPVGTRKNYYSNPRDNAVLMQFSLGREVPLCSF